MKQALRIIGILLLAVGLTVTVSGLSNAGALQSVVADFGLSLLGAGAFLEMLVSGLGTLAALFGVKVGAPGVLLTGDSTVSFVVGLSLWAVGWVLVARSYRAPPQAAEPASVSIDAPLAPRLANFRDMHWGTLAAYGFGILFAEVVFVGLYMAIVSKGAGSLRIDPTVVQRGLAPVDAFLIAFFVGCLLAFAAGFVGTAHSKRLSTPEATIALLYFGLPVPIFLTLMHAIPQLMLSVGYQLRELAYLSELLGEGRPELGYWLVTVAFGLAFFIGINLGFVSTSSGRLDFRLSYELFVASRHVSVFRPQLLFRAFGVLILGIVPPLVVGAMLRAVETIVERTRVKRVGLKDPLKGAEALNELKLRAQTPTALMTEISVVGVGIGVMALIIVLSVMSGFEEDLQKKILGTNSHGLVMKYAPDMPEYQEVMTKISQVRGVTGQTPFILNEVMVSSEGNVSGSMIKGIDPSTVGSVTDLLTYVQPGGSVEGLSDPKKIKRNRLTTKDREGAIDDRPADALHEKQPQIERHEPGGDERDEEGAPKKNGILRDPLIDLPEQTEDTDDTIPGILIGRELAASLRVLVGDRVNVMSPIGGELGPQGPMPKSRPFRVAGIFYSGMFEYDSKFVYIHLKEAQSFFGVTGASGIEIKVKDVDDARGIMKTIYDTLEGYPYRTKDWGEMNRNLFAALRLEKLVMGIILSIIVIVAAGLIVATVIMLVLEKRKEIAVLKALGVSDGGVVKIFLAEGLQIGVAGSVLGLISGLGWCFFIEKVGIKLDPQVYYIPALPVRIEPFQTALSVVIAILVTFMASIYPALKASQVEPVEGLKAE